MIRFEEIQDKTVLIRSPQEEYDFFYKLNNSYNEQNSNNRAYGSLYVTGKPIIENRKIYVRKNASKRCPGVFQEVNDILNGIKDVAHTSTYMKKRL